MSENGYLSNGLKNMVTSMQDVIRGTYVNPNAPMTVGQFNAYMKANPKSFQPQTPAFLPNPMPSINSRYTQAPSVDSSLSPMALYQQAKQSGSVPVLQNSFTPQTNVGLFNNGGQRGFLEGITNIYSPPDMPSGHLGVGPDPSVNNPYAGGFTQSSGSK